MECGKWSEKGPNRVVWIIFTGESTPPPHMTADTLLMLLLFTRYKSQLHVNNLRISSQVK